jgi:hypothetical protein
MNEKMRLAWCLCSTFAIFAVCWYCYIINNKFTHFKCFLFSISNNFKYLSLKGFRWHACFYSTEMMHGRRLFTRSPCSLLISAQL